MGNWQDWLNKWAIWWSITNQSQPNQTIRLDGQPCTNDATSLEQTALFNNLIQFLFPNVGRSSVRATFLLRRRLRLLRLVPPGRRGVEMRRRIRKNEYEDSFLKTFPSTLMMVKSNILAHFKKQLSGPFRVYRVAHQVVP